MKKSVIIGIIGVAASISAFGQGQIAFGNYYSSSQTTGIYWGSGSDINAFVGSDQDVTITLWYGSTGSTTISELTSSLATTASIQGAFDSSATVGTVPSNNEGLLNTYSLPVDSLSAGVSYDFAYEVTAVLNGQTYVGYSTIFALTTTANSVSPISSYIDHNSVAINPVPEPTTLALAGLGGLASLMAFRRKKA